MLTQTQADALIDRFVDAVNSGDREPICVDIDGPVSPSIMNGEPDSYGLCDWMIRPYPQIDWIEPMELRLGHRLPGLYRSLATRYVYPQFEAGDIGFFGNTPEGADFHELRDRVFTFAHLLAPGGYIEFGKPYLEASFDPVCFDLNRGDDMDRPIVRFDHEEIQFSLHLDYTGELFGSLAELIEAVIAGG